jgi:hypothetical protein
MNTIEKIKAEAQKAKVDIANKEKRDSIAKQYIPIFKEIIASKYGNIELLKFEYGRLPAQLVTISEDLVLAVKVRKDPGYSFGNITIRALYIPVNNTTQYNVNTDSVKSFSTPEEAVDCFVDRLTSCYSVDKASLVLFADSIPDSEDYFVKCKECGNTSEFAATELCSQRVLVDRNLETQEGLGCPDYQYINLVCTVCESTNILVKNNLR